jgi:phosphoglucomutase
MPETSNVLQWFCDERYKGERAPVGTEPKINSTIEVKA